jgi:hypothetical protein
VRIPLIEVWDAIQPDTTRRDRIGGLRLSEIMQKFGYKRTTMRGDRGNVVRGYVGPPMKLDFGEIPE